VAAALAGCVRRPPPPPAPVPHPHPVLGRAYQLGGHWYYPDDGLALDQTGIASVAAPGAGLTADGEAPDATLATAAMQTVPLPAIAEVTNLENGRQIRLRVNDRGPASPGRLIALSPRAAFLLQVPSGGARVRVQIDAGASRRVIDALGGIETLAMQAAPRAAVTEEALPPPGSGARLAARPSRPAQTASAPEAPPVPDRLPERILLVPAHSGEIWLEAGEFGRFTYANARAARLSGLGGTVLTSREGRQTRYAVRAGPFPTIAAADAALQTALRLGIPDAHLIVE
jgi:rare lipoprotein A